MATTVVMPLADYPEQSRVLGPAAVPTGITQVMFSVQRNTPADVTIWPSAAVTISLVVEVSYDAGSTWRPLMNFVASGGQVIDKDTGVAAPVSAGVCTLDQPGLSGRQVRGTLTIAGGTLRSSASVTTL